MTSFTTGIVLSLVAVAGVGLALTFEHPPAMEVQRGYRGTGMVQDFNPRIIAAEAALNKLPATLPPLHAGPKASATYKNVKVLGDLDVGAFTRLMASITTWVAPKQGCAYCHSLNNMASDDLYTKVVARRMIQMVRHINGGWQTHVQNVGVTCFTCHRSQPVPANLFYNAEAPSRFSGMAESQVEKNHPTKAAAWSALPYDPFTPFLEHDANIRVEGQTPLAGENLSSIKQTEWTYALMLHFSQSLGVNCTYCHETRQFSDWSQSSPQRVTAWYGIRMVRDLNVNYLDALQNVFPHARLGPMGDSPKVDCATCHQGVYKPLFGASPIVGFPELVGPKEAEAAPTQ